MAIIRVTKEFSFEMAHALVGYDGPCREIHGHSYKLFVTVKGKPITDPSDPKYGMVIDFGEIKHIVNHAIVQRYDHAFIMLQTEQNRPLITTLRANYTKVEVVDYQPTCENMVAEFARMIREQLPCTIQLHCVKLHETATSFAEWYAEDNG